MLTLVLVLQVQLQNINSYKQVFLFRVYQIVYVGRKDHRKITITLFVHLREGNDHIKHHLGEQTRRKIKIYFSYFTFHSHRMSYLKPSKYVSHVKRIIFVNSVKFYYGSEILF